MGEVGHWLEVFVLAVFSAGGAYSAVAVNMRWLRRDIDNAHERITQHDKQLTELYVRIK